MEESILSSLYKYGFFWYIISNAVVVSSTYNTLLRILGVTIEGCAIVLEGEIYEYPLITLSDKTVIDQPPNLIGHYTIYNKITIGPCKFGGIVHEQLYVENALITSRESRRWNTFIGTYNEEDNFSNSLHFCNASKLKTDASLC